MTQTSKLSSSKPSCFFPSAYSATLHSRIELCAYSGYKVYPGRGRTLIKPDGKVRLTLGFILVNSIISLRDYCAGFQSQAALLPLPWLWELSRFGTETSSSVPATKPLCRRFSGRGHHLRWNIILWLLMVFPFKFLRLASRVWVLDLYMFLDILQDIIMAKHGD